MVRVKYCSHPRAPVNSPDASPMASEDVVNISSDVREPSLERIDSATAQMEHVASAEVPSDQEEDSDHSGSEDFGSSGNTSNNAGCVKVGADAALHGISFDFGCSKVMKDHILALESFHYFLKGYAHTPELESVLATNEDEAVVFEDLFIAGLRLPSLINTRVA
jgi:hypothetical protein